VLQAVRDSFVSGLQVSFRVVAAIAAVGFVIALLNIRGRATAPAEAAQPAEETA
jgi:hypothetical protein